MEPIDYDPDPKLPGSLQSILNEADYEHFDEGEEPEPVTEEDETDSFDGEIGSDVLGLLNLGRLQKKFDVLGHNFVLKTLTVGEELAIGQVVNEYAGTIGQGKAFQTAVIAAAIVTVDGRELVAPLGPNTQAGLQDRFDYITEHWYIKTIDAAFQAYNELLQKQQAAYDALLVK